jgi:membrane-associated PAP2 superfamily phosphatase
MAAMSLNLSFLVILVAAWGLLVLCLAGLMIYRGVIGRNEETELMVDQAEHRFAEEQQAISNRITQLSIPIRYMSIAVGVLLLVIIGVWIYQGLQSS